jgi:hypothetical protein
LGSYDVILGYDWLQSHSPMDCNWKATTLTFQYYHRTVTLQEISPSPSLLSEVLAD